MNVTKGIPAAEDGGSYNTFARREMFRIPLTVRIVVRAQLDWSPWAPERGQPPLHLQKIREQLCAFAR